MKFWTFNRTTFFYSEVKLYNRIKQITERVENYSMAITEDWIANLTSFSYQRLLKPVFFRIDPEKVHESVVSAGQLAGKSSNIRGVINYLYNQPRPILQQKILGINFSNPVGLSAGFDYNANLTQLLPAINFGFATVGTVTNLPFDGNPGPRLGRLPRSKSLMVNKGFKNIGVSNIVSRLEPLTFSIPIGISIGKTNIPEINTVEKSLEDIMAAFVCLEKSQVKHQYYELNISCPNLSAEVNFYKPENLKQLLQELSGLKITRPVFVKMPINEGAGQLLQMLEIIVKYKIQGVIIGNLQKDKTDLAFHPGEVNKYKTGNYSGKPTEKKSNELIKLCYKHYGKRLVILGCGGVFNAEDAYTKIKSGASLVQLITGLVYQGPQLVTQINSGLEKIAKREGVKNISDLVGADVR